MRQRLHHGNSSGDEEVEGLLGTRIGSKNFSLSDGGGGRRKLSKRSKGKKGQASFFTMYCTLISYSGALILTIIGIYMSSNSRFFILGGADMEKNRAEKTTHVFLAAALYLVVALYMTYKWRNGKAATSVRNVGRIN